ncbi:MAG: hypothetical protein ABSA39_05350 [Edaphobacter sp.]
MRQREIEIVRDGDTKFAPECLFTEYGKAVKLLLDVEKSRGLIQQECRPILREASRQQNALPLAPAECAEGAITMFPTMSPFHGLLYQRVVFFRLEPSISMGVSTHCHQLACREGKIGMYRLWQMTNSLRQFAKTPMMLISPLNFNRAGISFAQPRKNVEQCALARTVDAKQRKEFSLLSAKSGASENLAFAMGKAEIFDCENVAQLFPPSRLPCMNSNSISAA